VNGHYLHPWLIAVFMLLFAVMSFLGMLKLIKERRVFGSGVLLLSSIIFAYSTWIAATLKG
jgi:hypothetical protein